MKAIAFSVELKGIPDSIKSVGELKKALKGIQDQLSKKDSTKLLKRNLKDLTTLYQGATKATAKQKEQNELSGKSARLVGAKYLTLSKEISQTKIALEELTRSGQGQTAQADQLRSKIAQLGQTQQQLREESRRLIQTKIAEEKTYRGLSNKLTVLRGRYKDLVVQEKGATIEAKKLRQEITALDSRLKKVDAATGQFGRNVGNYGSSLRGLGRNIAGAFGWAGLVYALAGAIKDAANVVVNFDKAMGELASVTQKSREELVLLEDQAKRLGGTTVFTAAEVAALQTELGRLGFDVNQIEASTKAVLDLSVATGGDAARAAALAGSALRAFGLEATEMDRVASVLAVSTAKSALSFDKLDSSLSTVAPVAKAFGFTIEETVALLGTLSNAGFDASSAATATRNILLNLADSNGALAKSLGEPIKSFDDLVPALRKLREEGVDLNTTLKLTDKRSVAAFNSFLDGADSAGELRDGLEDVNDELQEMVDKQLDTIAGDLKGLRSAWEGLVLSIEDGDGIMSNVVRGFIGSLTELLQFTSAINSGDINPFKGLAASAGDFVLSPVRLLAEAITGDSFSIKGMLLDQAKDSQEIMENIAKTIQDGFAEAAQGVVVLEDEIDRLTKKMEGLDEGSESFNQVKSKVVQLTAEMESLQIATELFAESTSDADSDLLALFDEGNFADPAKTIGELEKELSGLQKSLKNTVPASAEFFAIQKKIDSINKALGKSTKKTKKELDALPGSIAFYKKALSDLQNEFERTGDVSLFPKIETAKANLDAAEKAYKEFLENLNKEAPKINSVEFLEQQIENLKKEFAQPGSGAALAWYVLQLKQIQDEAEKAEEFIQGVKDRVNDNNDLQSLPTFTGFQPVTRDEGSKIDEINERATREINAQNLVLKNRLKNDKISSEKRKELTKETQAAVKQIELQAQIDIIDIQLENGKLSEEARLQLVKDRIEKELELEKGKNVEVKDDNELTAKEMTQAIISQYGSLAATLLSLDASRIDQALTKEIDALNTLYAEKIEGAQGNALLEAEFREELEEKKRKAEIKAAEERKQIAKTEAIIQGALAVIKAIPVVPLMALAASTIPVQLAIIDAQKFEKGGLIKGLSHRQGGVLIEAEGDEYVVNKQAVRDRRVRSLTGTNKQILESINLNQTTDSPARNIGIPVSHLNAASKESGLLVQTKLDSIETGTRKLLDRIDKDRDFQNQRDEDLKKMFDDLAKEVTDGVYKGARKGAALGLNDGNRRIERELKAEENAAF